MTHQTDRELIQRLVNELQGYRVAHPDHEMPALEAGRVRLAQPEPEGPTDEEIERFADDAGFVEGHAYDECGFRIHDEVGFARAVLARWGRPAIEPVPVAERPWKREGWCDAEGRCWLHRPAEIPCRLANGTLYRWVLDTPCGDEDKPTHDTHSLPHHALPLPQQPS